MIGRAPGHALANRAEIEGSGSCACFHCLHSFPPAEIDRWLADGTACCPHCTIDSVIGDASALPIDDETYLRALHDCYFGAEENGTGASPVRPLILAGLLIVFILAGAVWLSSR